MDVWAYQETYDYERRYKGQGGRDVRRGQDAGREVEMVRICEERSTKAQ